MAWQKGPLPPDTWYWGGVVPAEAEFGSGFYFADFCGDHAKLIGFKEPKTLKADEIAWFNNCLDLPPREAGVTGRATT